jgi:hypothetical protein
MSQYTPKLMEIANKIRDCKSTEKIKSCYMCKKYKICLYVRDMEILSNREVAEYEHLLGHK